MASFDPSFNGFTQFIDTGDAITFDDIQFFDDITAINNITNKNIQTRYVDKSNGNEYRWDGSTLILMNSGSGAISISAGNQINITGTLPSQIINVNTNPTFNTVSLTTQSAINHAVRKDYVDGANTNLQNQITTNTNNITTLQNTDINLQGQITTNTNNITSINNSKGQPFGIAPLNSVGYIDNAYLNPSVMDLQGGWNATTNFPLLVDGTGNTGDTYLVEVGGTQFTPAITFEAGDLVLYLSGKWKKTPNKNTTYVNSSGNTILVDNTNPALPLISTTQELNSTATPNFIGVLISGPIDNGTKATTKTYVDNNLNAHIGSATAHSAGNITTSFNGNYITASKVQINLQELDQRANANALNIATNTTNINNHINSTTAHSANFITTSQNLNYITASQVQNNLSQLDIRAFVNAGNFTNHVNGTLNRHTASHINTDTTNFNNRLSIVDNDTQKALDTLDNFIETDNTINNTNGTRNYATGIKVKNALDNLDTQTKTNTDNFSNHVAGVSFKHTANDITTNTAGFVISANDVQLNLGQLDAGILVNTNNFTNHVNGTTNRHTASHINNDTTGRTYLTQANLDLVNDDIDSRLVNLTTNKIDTITSSDIQTLTISGTGTSRALNPQTNTNNGLLKLASSGYTSVNGAIPIGNGTNFTTNTITGTTNQINITNGAGTITLSAPQDLHLTANTEFASVKLTAGLPTVETLYLTNSESRIRLDGTNAQIVLVGNNAIQELQGSNAILRLTGIDGLLNLTGNRSLISGGGIHRNLLSFTDVQVIRQSTNSTVSTSINSYGSMLLSDPVQVFGWDRMYALHLPYKKTAIVSNSSAFPFFAVQLTGSYWGATANSLIHLLIGLTTSNALSISTQWITTDFRAGFDLRWEGGANRVEKGIYGRFVNTGATGVEFNYGGFNAGVRTGYTTDNNPSTNDVIIFYLNPTTYKFTIEWRNSNASYAIKSTGTINHPDGLFTLGNFNQSGLVPIISPFVKDPTAEIKVLSQRECHLLGINVSNGQDIFY